MATFLYLTLAYCHCCWVFRLKLKFDIAYNLTWRSVSWVVDTCCKKPNDDLLSSRRFSKTLNFILFVRIRSVRELHHGWSSSYFDCRQWVSVMLHNRANDFLFRKWQVSVRYMLTRGYSTYESRTAVLLSTHLHTTQVLFRAVRDFKIPPCHSWFSYYPHQLNNLT